MKRFRWPLQRLLQVTEQRELALRSEVLDLFQQTTALRRQVLQRTGAMRSALEDLARADLSDRLTLQEIFLAGVLRDEQEVEQLQEKIRQLSEQRARRSAELTRVRRSRENLERRREEALKEHRRDELKREQKQFDQNAQIAFARNLCGRRVCTAEFEQ